MRLLESRSPAAEGRGHQHVLKGTAWNLRSLIFIVSGCSDSPQSCFTLGSSVYTLTGAVQSLIGWKCCFLVQAVNILALLDFIDWEPWACLITDPEGTWFSRPNLFVPLSVEALPPVHSSNGKCIITFTSSLDLHLSMPNAFISQELHKEASQWTPAVLLVMLACINGFKLLFALLLVF